MLRVGLTGGMASGKSTVASMLRAQDCSVLDADTIGHELLEEGQDAYKEVVATFGIDVLDQHGNIDRAELGKIVFAEPEKLKVLNAILHPRIRKVVEDWFAALARSSDPPDVAVVEAALLFESGFSQSLDKMMVCWCRPEQQLERMLERGLPRMKQGNASPRKCPTRKSSSSPTPPSIAPARSKKPSASSRPLWQN